MNARTWKRAAKHERAAALTYRRLFNAAARTRSEAWRRIDQLEDELAKLQGQLAKKRSAP